MAGYILGAFFLCLFGFCAGSVLKPCIYFILRAIDVFDEDTDDYDEPGFRVVENTVWVIVSALAVFISGLVILCTGGAKLSFTIGCIIGFVFTLFHWFYFCTTAEGKIAIIYLRLCVLKQRLDALDYSHLDSEQRNLYEEIQKAMRILEKQSNSILLDDAVKIINDIAKSNRNLELAEQADSLDILNAKLKERQSKNTDLDW